MVRPIVAWLLALSLYAGAATADGQSLAPAPSAALFSGAAAKQQVDALAGQIGSRPAGSSSYDQAVQYAADQLRQWGYQPTLQSFGVQTYADRGARVGVTGPAASSTLEVATDTLTYSAAGDLEAPLVAAGLGAADDFSGLDARGKLVLLKRGSLRFSDKVANAAAAGALGVLVYNDAPERVQGALLGPSSIPAVTISGQSGQALLELLSAGPVTLHLSVDGAVEQRQGTNVVAELPGGGGPSSRTVVFGAHLDSVPAGPGANDNGSGSAVVLELAHTLAQRDVSQRPFTLRFILFGAEELGLYGSRAYVDRLPDAERQSVLAMINLDMVGVGDAWRFGGTDDLVQRALNATADLGLRALPLRGPLASASDHASFLDAGIPAVFIYRVEDPNYHTAGDRPELVDPDALGQAGTIALAVLGSLSSPQ
jgi:Zn-dependent M28 family amino/carboxypeptidase